MLKSTFYFAMLILNTCLTFTPVLSYAIHINLFYFLLVFIRYLFIYVNY